MLEAECGLGNVSPRVTVAMAVYNGTRFLREAIGSILAQQFEDFELIVVDDGSTDGSVDLANEMALLDSRIVVLRASHGGIACATNRALDLARGEYFAPMDQDDVALPTRLARLVSYLDAHPEASVVGGGARQIDENGVLVDAEKSVVTLERIDEALARRCAVLHPTSMMRTQHVRDVGGYRPQLAYAHDYDLFLRLSEHHELANVDETLLYKRRHLGQVTQDRRSRAGQVVAGALAYLSHVSRMRCSTDFLEGGDNSAEAGARFIDCYLAENAAPATDVVHHISRFLRYAPLAHDGQRASAAVYIRYLMAASRAGGAREFLRTGYYLSAFHMAAAAARIRAGSRTSLETL